jgi:tryptophan-rich sensory protein
MIFYCDEGSAPIAAAALPFAPCWTLASGRARVFSRLIYSMMRSPLLGMLNIVPQWILIVATTAIFYRLDKIAALCLLLLVVGVALAAVINFTILKVNA